MDISTDSETIEEYSSSDSEDDTVEKYLDNYALTRASVAGYNRAYLIDYWICYKAVIAVIFRDNYSVYNVPSYVNYDVLWRNKVVEMINCLYENVMHHNFYIGLAGREMEVDFAPIVVVAFNSALVDDITALDIDGDLFTATMRVHYPPRRN